MTPSGIEPATYLFVAQVINHYTTARTQIVPFISKKAKQNAPKEVSFYLPGLLLPF
jgi:hypothetical protein